MTSDWQLEKDPPQLVELRRSIWAKWRILARDEEFVRQTLRLRNRLEQAFAVDPQSIIQFFHSFSLPTGSRLSEIKTYLKAIPKEPVRVTLRDYVKYAARFGVIMYFRKKQPHFRTQALPPWGSKFHATIRNGHLQPVTDRGGVYKYQLENEKLKTPPHLEDLIKTGNAKFVRIDDKDGSSVLTELEAFAYHVDGLTFILHRAEQPYIICLIGEKTSSKTWRVAERVVHALQRQWYKRVNAGRPADIKQIIKVAAALRKPGTSKGKAIDLGKTENAWTSQSAFSSQKSKLT